MKLFAFVFALLFSSAYLEASSKKEEFSKKDRLEVLKKFPRYRVRYNFSKALKTAQKEVEESRKLEKKSK